jgi:hypothetical protein
MQEGLADVMGAFHVLSSGGATSMLTIWCMPCVPAGGQDDRHQLSASLQPLLNELKGTSDPFQLYLSVIRRILDHFDCADSLVLSTSQEGHDLPPPAPAARGSCRLCRVARRLRM